MTPSIKPERVLGHCPVCHAPFAETGVQLLGERGPARLFHCACTTCGQALLSVVIEIPGSVSSVSLVTDLSFEDVRRVRDLEPTSQAECLQMHRAIQDGKAWCLAVLDKNERKS